MKCTNCGMEIPDGSTVCFECGAPQKVASAVMTETPVAAPEKKEDGNRCRNCGAALPAGSTVCFECGAPQNVVKTNPVGGSPVGTAAAAKSKILAAILAFFFGCYGIDQFYLGYMKKGVFRIVVTFVTFSFGGVIWGIVDCIRIATGIIKVDANGNPIL